MKSVESQSIFFKKFLQNTGIYPSFSKIMKEKNQLKFLNYLGNRIDKELEKWYTITSDKIRGLF